MLIKFKQEGPNKKCVWNIANIVLLKSGDNEVEKENWEKVKNHPTVLRRIEDNVLEVHASEVAAAEKVLEIAKEKAEKKNKHNSGYNNNSHRK
jgi:hypothetical protein